MSDLSVSSTPTPEFGKDETPSGGGLWLSIKKAASRVSDWFVIQSAAVKLLVVIVALMIPVTGIYSFVLMQKRRSDELRGQFGHRRTEALRILLRCGLGDAERLGAVEQAADVPDDPLVTGEQRDQLPLHVDDQQPRVVGRHQLGASRQGVVRRGVCVHGA